MPVQPNYDTIFYLPLLWHISRHHPEVLSTNASWNITSSPSDWGLVIIIRGCHLWTATTYSLPEYRLVMLLSSHNIHRSLYKQPQVQEQIAYTLDVQHETTMPYEVLWGQVSLGEVLMLGWMKMLVVRCWHADKNCFLYEAISEQDCVIVYILLRDLEICRHVPIPCCSVSARVSCHAWQDPSRPSVVHWQRYQQTVKEWVIIVENLPCTHCLLSFSPMQHQICWGPLDFHVNDKLDRSCNTPLWLNCFPHCFSLWWKLFLN